VGVRHRVRQAQRIAGEIDRRDAKILGHSPWIDLRLLPGRATHELAASTGAALEARRMVVHEHAIAGPKGGDVGADRDDLTDRLMAEHQRRLLADVPRPHVAGAEAARARPHQGFAGRDRGHRLLLDSDVEEVVQARDLHDQSTTEYTDSTDLEDSFSLIVSESV